MNGKQILNVSKHINPRYLLTKKLFLNKNKWFLDIINVKLLAVQTLIITNDNKFKKFEHVSRKIMSFYCQLNLIMR